MVIFLFTGGGYAERGKKGLDGGWRIKMKGQLGKLDLVGLVGSTGPSNR